MKHLILLLSFFSMFQLAQAQVAVGQWREHLPYGETIDVADGGAKVYCATPFAVFSFDKTDNSIERISKVNLLSGSDVTAIEFDKISGTLLVGYNSGNIDVIRGKNAVPLIDIAQSSLLANKRINSFFIRNGLVYVCTGFGVVVVDIERLEVRETWFLEGQNNLLRVNHITTDGNHWYASTVSGIFKADLNNSFLVSFEAWSRLDDLPLELAEYNSVHIVGNVMYTIRENGFEDELWVADVQEQNWTIVPGFESSQLVDFQFNNNRITIASFNRCRVFEPDFTLVEERFFVSGQELLPRKAVMDDVGKVWIANERNGLCGFIPDNNSTADVNIRPEGPPAFNARRISAFNNNIWIASGGVDATWTNNYDRKGIFGLVDDRWVVAPSNPGLNDIPGINDLMSVAIHPVENNKVYLGSWEEGLIEVTDGVVTEIFNQDNSPINMANFGGTPRIGVAGTDFDQNGNLWFTNAYTSQSPLIVKKRDGGFVSYNFQPQLTNANFLGDVMATRQGYIWAILPRGNGLLVFDHNGTLDDQSDDQYRVLTNQPGNGGLPNNDIYSIEEDLNGEIWVGTLQGIAVFYAPQSLFGDGQSDAQQILIEQDGNIQILLETEQINAIEIDGANRKWVGTAGSGIFLLSPNGQETIEHFTTRNSPLISNNIFNIAINHGTGEIFFATERGVISYMSEAKNFDQEIEEVRVYPNPVRNDYFGDIIIDGLAFDSDVKITDTAGNIVYATRSNGGRATWDGNGREGRRVASGIYLVFASSPDGQAANVGKVAIIR